MTQVHHSLRLCALGLLGVAALSTAVRADDWPQFRGPGRTGVSAEKGLLKAWPTGGPKLLWKATDRGEGHATPSVSGGKVYGMGLRAGSEVVWAVDARTGNELWSTKIAGGIALDADQGGYGSRATPTIDGDRIYVLGVGGDLACLNLADGKIRWQKSLVKEFGGHVPTWGYCESPLVDGDRVIAAPGGRNTVVAFHKRTGEVAWQCAVPQKDGAHYSSAILADVSGQKEIIHFLSGGVIGMDAGSGKFLWRYNAPANGTANCSAPIFRDGYVFAASAYGTGGGLAKVTGSGAQEVYFTKQMQNHHGGMVLVGDYLYGYDNNNLTCLEFKTGKLMWSDRSVGKGSVTCVDGMLYCRSERGPVALVEANPAAYTERGRFDQPERSNAPSWPYPVVANGHFYLRDQGNLFCYEVRGAGR